MDQTLIYLTDIDARKFLLFQKHYELFDAMEQSKALDVKYGKITLNILQGKLQNIVKEEIVYHI